MSNLLKNQYKFITKNCSIFLRMRKVTDKSCRQNQNINFMFETFFRKSYRFDIMCKNIVELDRPQMKI